LNINRKELLSKFLLVEPGIQKQESLRQSSCVILRRGRIYSMSHEIACSIVSGLPLDWEGAVRADKLMALLKESSDEEVEIRLDAKQAIRLKGCGKGSFPLEDEIVLPIDNVERPKVWSKLPLEFSEAVDLAYRCTKKQGELMQECVHLHPKWIEGSDNTQVVRYNLSLGELIPSSVMIRGETIKEIAQLGMTKGSETDNWLHFHNPLGLRMSLRKFAAEHYPDFEPFLNTRGRKVILPKSLEATVKRTAIFADDKGRVKLTLSKDKILLEGRTEQGEWEEELETEVKYKGEPITAYIPHKLLLNVISNDNGECEAAESLFRINGGNYIYACSLEAN
jgi:hypothetical protein